MVLFLWCGFEFRLLIYCEIRLRIRLKRIMIVGAVFNEIDLQTISRKEAIMHIWIAIYAHLDELCTTRFNLVAKCIFILDLHKSRTK